MTQSMIAHQLEPMILAVLADGPQHGYGLIEALKHRSGGAFALPEGTVYPALHRLESRQLLASAMTTVAGRQRRTYRLTAQGRRELAQRREAWQTFAGAVGAVLGVAPA